MMKKLNLFVDIIKLLMIIVKKKTLLNGIKIWINILK